MKSTMYHNPRCSKSRQTLALVQEHAKTVEIIGYLKTPLTASEIKKLTNLLNKNIREIIRTKEQEYKALALNNTELSDEQLITAVSEHPKLLERPIVVVGNKAVIGRPPQNVLDLF